jgi:hypothetical protein
MEHKERTTSTLVPKKPRSQPVMPPIGEETQESSYSTKQIPRDYIPPRKPSTTHIHLQKEAMYPLV